MGQLLKTGEDASFKFLHVRLATMPPRRKGRILSCPLFFFVLFRSAHPLELYIFALDVTQIRGHTLSRARLSPLHCGTRVHFYRGKMPAVSSLVDLRRIVCSLYSRLTGAP